MAHHMIAKLLAGKVPVGETVTVKGWVRTRRDSKAGLSFVNVHDGTCFAPIQVVAPGDLPNYADRDQAAERRLLGRRHRRTGGLAGPGPERRAEGGGRSRSWAGSTTPRPTRCSPSATSMEYLREVAHLRPRTNIFGAVTRVRNCLAQAMHRFFHEHGFYWIHTPIITASDCRGRRRDVPRLHPGPGQPAAHARGQDRLQPGLLRPRGLPDRVRAAQRRDLLLRPEPGLHLRPDLPRRELQHQPPPVGVLDDRAGDRLRRPEGRRRPGRGLPAVHLQGRAGRARRRHGVLRRARRQGGRVTRLESFVDEQLRAHELHRGRRGAGEGAAQVRVPRHAGAWTCRPSTSAT